MVLVRIRVGPGIWTELRRWVGVRGDLGRDWGLHDGNHCCNGP